MKLNERLRADREVYASLEGKEKLYFIWDYYKIPIIALVCALVLLALSLATGVGAKKTAMYAVFVNSAATVTEPDPEALNDLLREGGVDMEGRAIDITANLTLGQALDESYDGQTTQVLAAMFGISGLDVFAADKPIFDRYASQDAFMDLSLLIEPELLEAFAGELYYYENSEGRTILGGLVLKPGSPLHEAGYYLSDTVIGIANTAQYSEEARIFLRQLVLACAEGN